MKSIRSGIIEIDKPKYLSTEYVENILKEQFGQVVRWAIVRVEGNKLKIETAYIA